MNTQRAPYVRRTFIMLLLTFFVLGVFAVALVSAETIVLTGKANAQDTSKKTDVSVSAALKKTLGQSNSLWESLGTNIFNTNKGNVGIGVSNPSAKLQVVDGAVLFNGSVGSTPTSGSGTRFMWIPAKGALRAGRAGGTGYWVGLGNEWNDANIGLYSTAFGLGTVALGSVSTAFGSDTIAVGTYSTAFGYQTNASGTYSTAFGVNTNASGYLSTAFGSITQASGIRSTSFGANTLASGLVSTAFGALTTASGRYSTAFNYGSIASGNYSVALGASATASNEYATALGYGTIASGIFSTALGELTIASGGASTVFGLSSHASGPQSIAGGIYVNASALNSIVFGKGVDDIDLLVNDINNSFMVGFGSTTPTLFVNGSSVGIGTVKPATTLDVNGMMRLVPLSEAPACSTGTEGAIYYDKAEKVHKGCDGKVWHALYTKTISGGAFPTTAPVSAGNVSSEKDENRK